MVNAVTWCVGVCNKYLAGGRTVDTFWSRLAPGWEGGGQTAAQVHKEGGEEVLG